MEEMDNLGRAIFKPLESFFRGLMLPFSKNAEEVRNDEFYYVSLWEKKLIKSMQTFVGRCKLCCWQVVMFSCLWIIPILICVKVDGVLSGSESALAQADWVVLLSPLLVLNILLFLGYSSMGAIYPAIRCGSLLTLEILLALKWDGSVDYRYSVILIPLYIHQILLLVRDEDSFGLDLFILRVIFLVLLTLQLDQDRGWDWNIVLIPIWIEVLLEQLFDCCYGPESGYERSMRPNTLIVITLALFSVKLNEATDGDEKNGFSSLWILFPCFLFAFVILLVSMRSVYLGEEGGDGDDSLIVADNLRARVDETEKDKEEVKFPITLDKAEEEKSDLEANNDALGISAGVDETEKDEEEVSPIVIDKEEEKSDLEANKDMLGIPASVDEADKDEEEVKSPIALDKVEEENSDLEANNNVHMGDRD